MISHFPQSSFAAFLRPSIAHSIDLWIFSVPLSLVLNEYRSSLWNLAFKSPMISLLIVLWIFMTIDLVVYRMFPDGNLRSFPPIIQVSAIPMISHLMFPISAIFSSFAKFFTLNFTTSGLIPNSKRQLSMGGWYLGLPIWSRHPFVLKSTICRFRGGCLAFNTTIPIGIREFDIGSYDESDSFGKGMRIGLSFPLCGNAR